jgi:hypothetical protein
MTGEKEKFFSFGVFMSHRMEGVMLKLKILILVLVVFVPGLVVAGDFDGSKPFLCAVIEAIECLPGEGCNNGTPESVNLPRFFKINVSKKSITEVGGSQGGEATKIERVEHIDGKLFIEGAEEGLKDVSDGLGWTMAINEESGEMVLTAAGDRVGFVVFGACTIP